MKVIKLFGIFKLMQKSKFPPWWNKIISVHKTTSITLFCDFICEKMKMNHPSVRSGWQYCGMYLSLSYKYWFQIFGKSIFGVLIHEHNRNFSWKRPLPHDILMLSDGLSFVFFHWTLHCVNIIFVNIPYICTPPLQTFQKQSWTFHLTSHEPIFLIFLKRKIHLRNFYWSSNGNWLN